MKAVQTKDSIESPARSGVLVLEDKKTGGFKTFEGERMGALVAAADIRARKQGRDVGYGEVVFNTSMTGYQEILTDPSYYGQMVCMTAPHIGNYGINAEDEESRHPWCAGFIVHDASDRESNWRSEGALGAYLEKHGIPGLSGVDTRALTLFLRQFGVVRGVLLPKEEEALAPRLLAEMPKFEGRDLISEVTTREPYSWNRSPDAKKRFKVAVLDFGVKRNMLRELEARGCELEVLPARTSAQEILERKPDGVFLSNGPGDPQAATYAVESVRGVLGKVPLFGVCMGHQILSLAIGGKTYKLKFGHRGGNQPVKDQETGRVEISSHNHGYAVDGKSLPKEAKVTHVCLNDGTVEGLEVASKRAFSVQYHPEACPGPHDSAGLFDRFIRLMEGKNAPKVP